MKANELRIGNYVYDDNEKVSRVEQISSYNICDLTTISSKRGILHTSDIYPIPLTEEWLLKFGFEFIDNSYLSPTFNLTGRLRIIGYEGNFRLVVNKFMTIKIESVHQLQNLCFALTGEELEIKL